VLALGFRLLVGVVVLLAAFGIFNWLQNTRPEPGRVDPDALRPRVTVFTAEALPVRRTWTGYGTARAMDTADVPARIAATVVSIPDHIDEGVAVGAGEVLARLDATDFEARLIAAEQALLDLDAQIARVDVDEARLRDRLELLDQRVGLAEAELARVEDAAASGAARPREVDIALGALAAVRGERSLVRGQLDALPSTRASLAARRAGTDADRRLAAMNVERCIIRNPLGDPDTEADDRRWIVQALDVEIGESVVLGQRIARVLDPGRIEVPIRVPSSARRRLRVGDTVELVGISDVNELGDQAVVRSTIARIAPEDDQTTRTTTVYAELRQAPADAAGIAPGRFLRARVQDALTGDRVLVPRRSFDGDRIYVVDDDGLVRGIAVDPWFDVRGEFPATGLPDQDWVVLRDPPAPGTQIVLTPGRRTSDGQMVVPVPVPVGAAVVGATGAVGAGTDP
jgi:multidrug resistance efflux pump